MVSNGPALGRCEDLKGFFEVRQLVLKGRARNFKRKPPDPLAAGMHGIARLWQQTERLFWSHCRDHVVEERSPEQRACVG